MEPKFKIGDTVAVIKGTKHQWWNTNISGWQGCIVGVHPDEEEGSIDYSLILDRTTLDNLSHDYIVNSIDHDQRFSMLFLSEAKLKPAQPRSTTEEDLAMAQEIEEDYYWYMRLGVERAERVLAVLDTSRKEDDLASELGAWKVHLNKKIKFPIDCTYEFPENLRRKSGSDRVSVEGIVGISTEFGLIAELEDGDIVPLSSCNAIKEKYKEVLEDYIYWITAVLYSYEGEDDDDSFLLDENADDEEDDDDEDAEWEEVK